MQLQGSLALLPLPCPQCGQEVPANRLQRHVELRCSFRMVPCPQPDCRQPVPANHVDAHLRFSCPSALLQQHYALVSKARMHSPYPRQWGLAVPLK